MVALTTNEIISKICNIGARGIVTLGNNNLQRISEKMYDNIT